MPSFDANRIVVAPFANERVREWPIEQFRRFIDLAVKDGMQVDVIGAPHQRVRANALVRGFAASDVRNTCGRMNWSTVLRTIGSAAYVVANNSGVAHAAASMNKWTLCLFGGAHAWIEWMPLGPRVITITRVTACSPCEIGGGNCPYGIACLTSLDAEIAYREFHARRMANEAADRANDL